MTLNPFAWVREQARLHFLAGIVDGCEAVAPDGPLAQLAERLKALPAAEPAEAEAAVAKRKAVRA